jgi:hypothetical protein
MVPIERARWQCVERVSSQSYGVFLPSFVLYPYVKLKAIEEGIEE